MANLVYNGFKKHISKTDWDDNTTTTIKILLVTSTYVPNIDTHEYLSDVTNEVTGIGYTAGGTDVIGRLITVDDTVDIAKWDATDATWGNSTLIARGAIVYKDTGVASTSPLIAYLDFVVDKESNAGDFIVQYHPDGIVKVS